MTDTIDLASARPSVQFPEDASAQPPNGLKNQAPKEARTDAFPGHLDMPRTKSNSSSKSTGRRNSLAALAERLRSRSRSHSRTRSQNRNSIDFSIPEDSRPSIDSVSEDRPSTEPRFDYDAIILAQHEFMERLRAEQLRNNVHTNIDGIPIPSPTHRRRSSITQILGMDKPLLAR
ncbi:hypothetical protein BGZ94_005970 [Podila epigama]|nr:hypothetical protein BGZ94_005970 [Podila epigama]